jgi:catechol 2,3-dioxygenase-like lactoylglutathione lyase family enzyme
MEIKYICSLLTVNDIHKSREFYEKVLKQEVELDHGKNVSFKGGFAIHDRDHFQQLVNNGSRNDKIDNGNALIELYFVSEEIDVLNKKLESLDVVFLHKIREQPWGQRVLRFFDPDDYIIEVGESMESVVIRFAAEGLEIEEISEKSSMPVEFVEMVLNP